MLIIEEKSVWCLCPDGAYAYAPFVTILTPKRTLYSTIAVTSFV